MLKLLANAGQNGVGRDTSERLPLRVPSIAAMEGALVALHELWWRSPGSGSSPWAKDGPWSLAQREVGDIAGHYSLTLLVTDAGRELMVRKLDTPRPRTPLSSEEVSARDAIGEWLAAVPDEEDRAMVRGASLMLWRGECRVGWADLVRMIGSARTADGLRGRYRKVLAEMVCRANGVPLRWARTLTTRDCVLAIGERD